MKAEVFKKELEYIKHIPLRAFVTKILNRIPQEFYEVPASSTGKYHPQYALGNGGLVRHTKACVGIAMDLIRCESIMKDGDTKRDIIIASLILHDGMKCGKDGKSNYTTTTHPTDMAEFIRGNYENEIHREQMELLCSCISSHMGQWNRDYKTGEEVLPKPKTGLERFVHMCDYLASRKCLEFNFNV